MALDYQITPTITARPLQLGDAGELLTVIDSNRSHLDRWLRWSGRVKTLTDAEAYILRFQDKLGIGDGFHLGLWEADRLIGGFICHFLNRESNKTEIGYWLSEGHTGKGLVTTVCTLLINYLIVNR